MSLRRSLNTRRFSGCLTAIAALAIAACQTAKHSETQAPDRAEPNEYLLTVLHTNDHHGRFWPNKNGEYGMAARKTLVDQIRAEVKAAGGYSLLLSGGDINTGVPESDTLDAEPDFIGMSEIGYDAMAVGNHEFDNSLTVIRKQQGWSNFPFLSANTFSELGERLFEPYKIFSFRDLDIAVIGLTTEKTAFIGNPEHVEGIQFQVPEVEAKPLVEELQSEVDVIIALTHIGHHQYDLGSDLSLARTVPGIDLIVGGHSAEVICVDGNNELLANYRPGQSCMPQNINDTWIVQAEQWGKYLGRIDFRVIEDNGVTSVELLRYQLIPVNLLADNNTDGKAETDTKTFVGPYIEPDKQLESLLLEYQSQGDAALAEIVGNSSGLFDRLDLSRDPNPTTLGKLIAEAYRQAAGADIGLMNKGGIRDNLEAGVITLRDILRVSPFGNTVVYADFSGDELLTYFRETSLLPENRMKLQFSSLEFRDGGLIVSSTGAPIEPGKTYRVAMNNFMALGGEGFPNLTNKASYVDTGLVDYQAIQNYIRKLGTLSPENF